MIIIIIIISRTTWEPEVRACSGPLCETYIYTCSPVTIYSI